MADLCVNLDVLHALSRKLAGHADAIARIADPARPARDIAAALHGTAFAVVCAQAGGPVAQAYQSVGERIRRMATTAEESADDYTAAETAFTEQLAAYSKGT